jgi:hypothetical protein
MLLKHVVILFLTLVAMHDTRAQWQQTNGLNGGTITSFASIGGTLFAATDSGVFISSDSGLNWINPVPDSPQDIWSIKALGQILFAGAYGPGVFRSTDLGNDWAPIDTGLPTNVIDLAIVGSSIYAGTYGSGVFRSNDSGLTWNSFNTGLPSPVVGGLTAIGSNLFVNDDPGGLFLSQSGSSWIPANHGLPGGFGTPFDAIGTYIFAGTYDSGIYLSKNGGIDWSFSGLGGYNVSAIKTVGSDIFTGGYDGIFLSTDSGQNWMPVNDGLSTTNVDAFAVIGSYILVGTGNAANWNGNGVWRRPLSDFGITAAVSLSNPISTSISTYPNPLSQSTTIRFTSPESGVARVTVVNLLGEEVARVFEGPLTAGEHSFMWSKPAGLPPGMYECVVQMNGSVQQVPVVVTSEP